MTEAHVKLVDSNTQQITFTLSDGNKVKSTQQCTLGLPQLPTKARTGYILPGLASHSLISVIALCDAGCETTFTKISVTIKYRGKIIMRGAKCTKIGLWMVSLQPTATPNATPSRLNIVEPTSTYSTTQEVITALTALTTYATTLPILPQPTFCLTKYSTIPHTKNIGQLPPLYHDNIDSSTTTSTTGSANNIAAALRTSSNEAIAKSITTPSGRRQRRPSYTS